MGHPFYLLAMVNLYCINDSTRDIDLPTRFDNISPVIIRAYFKMFLEIPSSFYFPKRIGSKVRLHLFYPQPYTHIHLYKINNKITFPHYPQLTKSYQHFIYTIKPILSTDNMGFIHKLWLILCITMLQYLILDLHLKLM